MTKRQHKEIAAAIEAAEARFNAEIEAIAARAREAMLPYLHCAWCSRLVAAPDGTIAIVCRACTAERLAAERPDGIEPRTAVNLRPIPARPDPFEIALAQIAR